MEPELLVADERSRRSTSRCRRRCSQLLDEIRKRLDLAMLFITHDLRVAAQVCDRVAVMHKGEVVEEGATAAVFGAPQHAYTRALFDSAPGREFRVREVRDVEPTSPPSCRTRTGSPRLRQRLVALEAGVSFAFGFTALAAVNA